MKDQCASSNSSRSVPNPGQSLQYTKNSMVRTSRSGAAPELRLYAGYITTWSVAADA
jgi:hypothetical protein